MAERLTATDLNQAIANEDIGEVRRLLDLGLDPNKVAGRWAPIAGQPALGAALTKVSSAKTVVLEIMEERERFLQIRSTLFKIIELLIERGADLNQLSPARTPLNLAVSIGDATLVKMLLEAGAKPEGISVSCISKLAKRNGRKVEDGFWGTALHLAAEENQGEIAEILIAAGADKKAINHEGFTPEDLARSKGHQELASYLSK